MQDRQVSDQEKQDLLSRWKKARIAAIRGARESAKLAPLSSSEERDEEVELGEFLQNIKESEDNKSRDLLLKLVFDFSRSLALSFSKFHNLIFEIEDLKELLCISGLACYQGQWQQKTDAFVLQRAGCSYCPQGAATVCDYWREACDGLIMGLGDNERFVRHSSRRHGDESCTDIIFNELSSAKKKLAWGQIPDHMIGALGLACGDFEEKMKIAVKIKGLNEGVLFYEFATTPDRLCGGGKILEDAFARKIHKLYPGLQLKEVSPLAVMGTEK